MSIDKIGAFHVIGPLGTGAHSTILHIRRNEDSRDYALKVVPISDSEERKFLDQARHEFEIAQQLNHPSLIKIFALETQRDWLFRVRKVHMLIEYVDGKTLDTFNHIPLTWLVQIFARVAAGLSHMHKKHICHADMKPNNVLVSRAGDVKVIDYGLGWIRGENKARVQGTLEYMAPEQAQQRTVTERSDIYNFGATMYRMVTSKLPPDIKEALLLEGRGWEKAVAPVCECTPDVPRELGDLIHHCLAYQPQRRPPEMRDVQHALEKLVREMVRTKTDRLEMIKF
jgi:serine/threonine protein kinase